ncbi:MAG: pilus assembly protein N-terminal domain-containing protein [Candidatus Omnitrophica bacterium]|nr:pilus assembly protein N-terminal domain-containing protein [Candidatus Omnitrophota bacterium]
MRKITVTLLLLSSLVNSLYASQIPAYLCEIGLEFYQEGRYDEALEHFKRALIVQPNYAPALKYIQMIQELLISGEEKAGVIPSDFKPATPTPLGAIKEALDLIELQREMMQERQRVTPTLISPAPKIIKKKKPVTPARVLTLDESLSKIPQPIDIEQGKCIILLGKNIQRFLVTQPNIITVEKKGSDELLVTGKDIGYTYLHVWDDHGRWTTEWLGIFPQPEGPTYEELMRREEERARNFKLGYTLDWSSYETGRRIDELNRGFYFWSHGLNLTGPTPYGDVDSSASIRVDKQDTDLTYFTLGLTDGQLGTFKGFALRGFDFSPNFSNLVFPGATIRGVMLYSPAFDNKLTYTTFWGREGGGRYGNLSPGLAKTKNSFLEGINLNYSPTSKQNYKFSALHGYGRDRENYLNHYGYDLMGTWNFDQWGTGYEIAFDSETFAHLLTAHFTPPKLNFRTELRNIDKNFLSMTASGWRQGERGGIFNLNYTPTEKISMGVGLDVYQDRLYPAEDNDNRLNEDFNWNVTYRVDPKTSFGLNYTLQNELGRLSQYRYQSQGLNISRTFHFIKDITTYVDYNHQKSQNFTSPSSDYVNDRFYGGLRFSLIGELYYYINKEINWLHEKYEDNHSLPNAVETGVDWSSQIGNTPLFGNFRFTYRNEEDTLSTLSFLSGEDYIEGYTELSYRPTPDSQIYGSSRFRNIWADNPNVSKRLEIDFNAGMRYLWDTGARWESVGNIEGYVFKDLNSDGLRQRDEPPVEGIKVWLGKDKFQVTDIFGYYKFKGVRARKAYVTLDTTTLPSGFVLTVPVTQEVAIAHHATSRIDFGIISRSEISGFIFEDVDENGEYSKNDKGVLGAVIILEDGKKAISDGTGRYSFPNVAVGEHTISLDLNSLPVYYLPKIAITKKITLFEGVTYIYNIPLKRIKE